MKLSAFVAIAAVIGGSFLIPVPADASAWVDLKIINSYLPMTVIQQFPLT